MSTFASIPAFFFDWDAMRFSHRRSGRIASILIQPYLFRFYFISRQMEKMRPCFESEGFSIRVCKQNVPSACITLPCPCREIDEPRNYLAIHNFTCIVRSSHSQFYFSLQTTAAMATVMAPTENRIKNHIDKIVFGSWRRWFTIKSIPCFDFFWRKTWRWETKIIPKRPIVRKFIYKRMNVEHAQRAQWRFDRNGGHCCCVRVGESRIKYRSDRT